MTPTTKSDDARGQAGKVGTTEYIQTELCFTATDSVKPPIVTGQCAEALALIRQHQPLLSFVATADYAIPEFAARVHNLRSLGFDVRTRIEARVIFRGRERKNAAFYSLGTPEWPAPGFNAGA